MEQLAFINQNGSIPGINTQAKELIEKFEANLLSNLKADLFNSTYQSIDDILVQKYHLTDITNMDFPDFSTKTEFIPKGVRGNIQKAEGKILTYQEADEIVGKGLNEEMP
jgi:hypothetical protein